MINYGNNMMHVDQFRKVETYSPKSSPRGGRSPIVSRQDSSGTLKTTISLGKHPSIVHSGPFYLMKEPPGNFLLFNHFFFAFFFADIWHFFNINVYRLFVANILRLFAVDVVSLVNSKESLLYRYFLFVCYWYSLPINIHHLHSLLEVIYFRSEKKFRVEASFWMWKPMGSDRKFSIYYSKHFCQNQPNLLINVKSWSKNVIKSFQLFHCCQQHSNAFIVSVYCKNLGESELTGATNLMAYYGLEHSYSKFSGKKVKEQLSSFLPNLPGVIDGPGQIVRIIISLSAIHNFY